MTMLQLTRHSVKQFLAQKSITEMENPPHSLDLAVNDSWLFSEITSALKGQRFHNIENIQINVMMALKAVLQQEFQKCFQQWQHYWAKCIAAQKGVL
jgi:hypothetical protein